MQEVVAGIDEQELRALSVEILDYHDRISALFDKVDSCMRRLTECYQGPPANKITVHYEAVQSSYPTVKDNIKSYSQDLTALIRKMHEGDRTLSNLFRTFTSDTEAQIRSNKFNLK